MFVIYKNFNSRSFVLIHRPQYSTIIFDFKSFKSFSFRYDFRNFYLVANSNIPFPIHLLCIPYRSYWHAKPIHTTTDFLINNQFVSFVTMSTNIYPGLSVKIPCYRHTTIFIYRIVFFFMKHVNNKCVLQWRMSDSDVVWVCVVLLIWLQWKIKSDCVSILTYPFSVYYGRKNV